MEIVLLISVFIGSAAVLCLIWAVNRQMKRKWLRKAKITDIVNHRLFDANMRIVLDDLNNQRAKAEAQSGEMGGRLKSHPIEHLIDEGVFNSKDMTELYLHGLQKTLIGYGQRDRQFIKEVGQMAYSRTMIQLLKDAGMAN